MASDCETIMTKQSLSTRILGATHVCWVL